MCFGCYIQERKQDWLNALIKSFSGIESRYDAQLGLAPRWIFVEKSVDMTEGWSPLRYIARGYWLQFALALLQSLELPSPNWSRLILPPGFQPEFLPSTSQFFLFVLVVQSEDIPSICIREIELLIIAGYRTPANVSVFIETFCAGLGLDRQNDKQGYACGFIFYFKEIE